MTRYELRAIGCMVYGAAITICNFVAATVRAASANEPSHATFYEDIADKQMRTLLLEYRANGGEVDAGERDE